MDVHLVHMLARYGHGRLAYRHLDETLQHVDVAGQQWLHPVTAVALRGFMQKLVLTTPMPAAGLVEAPENAAVDALLRHLDRALRRGEPPFVAPDNDLRDWLLAIVG